MSAGARFQVQAERPHLLSDGANLELWMDPPMRLLGFLASAQRAKHLAEAAIAIARRCRAEVLERCERRAVQMSAAEARGYIRARAAAVVYPEAQLTLTADSLLGVTATTELLDQATEAVVELVHVSVLQQRSRSFARRRAA